MVLPTSSLPKLNDPEENVAIGAARFVRGKETLLPRASGVAVTVNDPVCVLAVQTTEAVPPESVRTDTRLLPLGKMQDAPEEGAAKSTRIPFSGVPAGDWSVT